VKGKNFDDKLPFGVPEMFGLIGSSIIAQIWDITNDCESSER